MDKNELFEEFKRFLLFTGRKYKDIYETEDAVVMDFVVGNKVRRLFITDQEKINTQLELTEEAVSY